MQKGNTGGKAGVKKVSQGLGMALQKPYTIIYQDESLIAVNKASGIAVVGERWEPEAPRLDLLLKQELSKGGIQHELFVVHRIDKDTSGLVIFAKNKESHKNLCAAFESREAEKTYIAIVHGRPLWPDGKASSNLPLIPDGNKKHLTIIDKYRGKTSHTAFTLLHSAGNYSVIEARPKTGRTHQIRVHLSGMGHPIVCDPLYGKNARSGTEKGVYLSAIKRSWKGDPYEERPLLSRLGLHALSLKIADKHFEAPLHKDMAALIKQMEKR